jgi:hypothetical protein
MITAILLLALLAPAAAWCGEDPSTWPILYQEDFSTGKVRNWEFADPKVWQAGSQDGRHFLSCTADSDYTPPVRSPQNIAWIMKAEAADFVIDATVRSTQAEYGHRDVCFLFGRQDDSHFYYVHLATKADEHANSIFLVNGEPRVSIATERTEGTQWTEGWRHVRIVRHAISGEILVYFEDMEKPVMRAVDTHFGKGRFGWGSFDDTADLAEIVIRGK